MTSQNNFKITATETKGLNRSFEVVAGADYIAKKQEEELKKIGKTVNIPGFRPGKAPMSMLKQRYEKSVLGEVIEKVVETAISDVIAENKLTPALRPHVEIKDYKEGGDLTISMNMELLPEIAEISFDGIALNKQVYEVDSKEIDKAIERLAGNNKRPKELAADVKAENGSVVVMDFEGFKDDVAFPGGKGEGFELELGSGQFIPGFEDQLIGSKAGDNVTVNVAFPKDYHAADLAGAQTRFEVKVHAVKGMELPSIDDEFAKTLGLESLEKLRELLAEKIGQEYAHVTRNKLKKELFDALDKKCTFEIPSGMVKMEFDSIWQQVEQAIKAGEKLEKPEEELKQEYQAIAERRVRLGLFLAHTAKNEKLEVSREELSKAVYDQAMQYPQNAKQIFDFYREHPEHLAEMRGPILEEKAVDFIISKVTINEKKVSLEELMADDED